MWYLLIVSWVYLNGHYIKSAQVGGGFQTEFACHKAEWLTKNGDMVDPSQKTVCVFADPK